MNQMKSTGKNRLLCLLLAVLVCAAGLALPSLSASAAAGPTSLGLAQHGIKAHADGWQYSSGAKGDTGSDGTRYSDCAGLIYAYFSDAGALGNCRGGATSQVRDNCVFSNDIDEGIPNIHGLVLTMPEKPEYADTGIYGHIGIYIGNNEAADNSDSYYNMRREPVVGSGRNWSAWHLFDNGMRYPVNGWYALDGKMVHYTDYEYDTDTVIDGYSINGEGYAEMPGGKYYPVDSSILSTQYASASQVKAHLQLRYSGVDTTYQRIYGGGDPSGGEEEEYNGRITGSGVRLRQEPNTQSAILDTLPLGASLDILAEVDGETVEHEGKSSSLWYQVTTTYGRSGYVCSLFAQRTGGLLTDPVITSADGYVTMTAGAARADIYYTTDGTAPSETSTPYTGPLFLTGHTFKAVAFLGSQKSGVTTATVLSSGAVFTDFTTDAWYYSAVDQAVSALIFQGKGNGVFAPNEKITRSQFVRALANLDRVDLSLFSEAPGFSDTAGLSKEMAQAVSWAVDTGLVKGFPDGTFRPSDPISREQMCAILNAYAGLEAPEDPARFDDDGKLSPWAKDAVYACRAAGLVSGTGNNLFDPKGTATRAQACTITVNLYQR